MTLHKLSAGDGYTYLTSQVARQDVCGVKGAALAGYYSVKGEAPGQWVGSGVAGLESAFVVEGGVVTEAQMLALFGEGIHPDADVLVAAEYDRLLKERMAPAPDGYQPRRPVDALVKRELMAKARSVAKLGRAYYATNEATDFARRCAAGYADVQAEKGYVGGTPMPEDERAAVRTKVGREMFAEAYGRPPADERELSAFILKASRTNAAVSGYDTTFSPVKSVSTLWAVAPLDVARVIEQAHNAAVRDALTWMEDTALFTRQGTNGVRQVDTKGLIATAFVHRDSRAGDPDLHTHVAIANKVQAVDGQWLAIDGRIMHKAAVSASERYNTVLEAELTARLGVQFAEREQVDKRKRPVREIVGVDPALMASWSSRREQIDIRRAELEAQFQGRHGRPPTPRESIKLAQQANLETREDKHEPRSYAEQRDAWATQARTVLGGERGVDAMVEQALAPADRGAVPARSGREKQAPPSPYAITGGLSRRWVAHVADDVVARVSSDRATWQAWHLEAEAARQVRAESRLNPAQVKDAISAVLAASLDPARSVSLSREDTLRGSIATANAAEPAALRRKDGASVYSLARGQMYSSQAILDAEQAVRQAALRDGGRVLDETVVEDALTRCAAASGRVLNPAQEQLVREMATSGKLLQLAIAPAGSGKTTAMSVLTDAWTTSGGSVLGLSPTAAAAAGLAEETGARAETLAMLVRCLDLPAAEQPDWVRDIDKDALVVIDEAGMASTVDLHAAVSFLDERGATIRLIGDDQQLSSISAGGVLRDIADEAGALTLHELVRFRSPAEAAATLAMRDGDTAAIGYYLDHNRVAVGSETSMIETTFAAWSSDQNAGIDSIMLAPRRDLVAALNARARTERLTREAAAAAAMGPDPDIDYATTGTGGIREEVVLVDGNRASVGDTVITRANDRRLRLSGSDFVRNGYRWIVTGVDDTGRLEVASTRTGAVITLPADYAAASVELGYATTIHAAQGITVERARVLADESLDRQMLYVALSRGRGINSLSLVTVGDGDPHDLTTPAMVHPKTPTEILEAIVTRDGSQTSATTHQRTADALEPALAHATAVYTDIIRLAAEDTAGPEALTDLTTGAEALLPGLTSEPAWPALRAHLATIYLTTGDTSTALNALEAAIAARELDTARDNAAVLEWRLDPDAPTTGAGYPEGPLPWLRAIPTVLADDPAWGPQITARAEHVHQLADALRTQAHDWTPTTAPAWVTRLGLPLPSEATNHPAGGATTTDLAIWRAATDTPESDPTISGNPRAAVTEARYQRALDERVKATAGIHATPGTGIDPISDAARDIDPRLTTDPAWPATHARLTALARAGIDIPALLAEVGATTHDLGPLPDDHAPDALWWRITDTLGPATLAPQADAPIHRPSWTATLTQAIGEDLTDITTHHAAWATLLSCVNAAQRAGLDPDETIKDALDHLTRSQTPGDAGVADRDLAPALAHAVTTLTRSHLDPDLTSDQWFATGGADDGPPFDPDYDTPPPTDDEPWPAPPGDPHLIDGYSDPEPPEWAPTDDDLTWLDTQTHHAIPPTTTPDFPDADSGPEPGRSVDPAPPAAVDERLAIAAADRDATDALRLAFPAPATEQTVDRSVAQRSWELNQAAQDFYTTHVTDSWVPDYLTDRLHHVPTGTGYAPAGWTTLTDHLRATCHATDDELITAGLAKTSARGTLIDIFRDRATFPLTDPAGHVVGFTARRNPARSDDEHAGPKYLNTPTTPTFTKSRHLDGLEHLTANPHAGEAGLVLVEGRLDAEAITHATGGRYIGIAPLGTALTTHHAALLATAARDGRPIIVATDADNAGRKAAANAYDLLTRHGITPRAVTWPEGTDPADLLNTQGPTALTSALDAHTDQADHIIATLAQPETAFVETRVWAAREAARIAAAQPTSRWSALLHHIQATTNVGDQTAKVTLADAATAHTDTLRTTLPTPPTIVARPVLPAPGSPTPPTPRPTSTTTTDPTTKASSTNTDASQHEHIARPHDEPTPMFHTPARPDPATVWASLADAIDPSITTDPAWGRLAHTIERLHAAGKDVASLLPALATTNPLDDEHPADELRARLNAAHPYQGPQRATAVPLNDERATGSRPSSDQHHRDAEKRAHKHLHQRR